MKPASRIIELRDPKSGSEARILSDFGFNCYEFRAVLEDRSVDVLWASEGFAETLDRASGSGIPLLFPFPGRLAGTEFRWQEQSFELEAGDGIGNPIHGFVLDRPWRVLQQQASLVQAEFQASVDAPELLDRWPGDYRIRGRYQLVGARLEAHFEISNPGEQPLPCGLGLHPYLRLPLGGDDAGQCEVALPVRKQWELVEMLPTGKVLDLPDADALQAGVPFSQMKYDDVFTDLVFDGNWSRSSIRDPDSGCVVDIAFTKPFRECVVYTPPHREAICIEPYTSVPGAVQMDPADDTGLLVLDPGQAVALQMVIDVRGKSLD